MRMGCCFSCNEDDDAQENEYTANTARQPLLREANNSASLVVGSNSDARNVGIADGQACRGQEDELARILQETASAMIDVSGSGSHSLDQREFQERSRQYLMMIQTLSPALLKTPTHLLGDVPNPEKHLGVYLISQEDEELMDWAIKEVEEALISIKVEHSEELVVPFGGSQAIVVSSPTPST